VDFDNPSVWYLIEDRLFKHGIGRGMYRSYADQLDLQGDENVLEVGSGTGALSKYIARRLLAGGGTLTCVDTSAALLDIARRRLGSLPHVEFRATEVADPSVADNAYDAAVIHFALHDVPRQERPALVNALAAKLRDTGTVFIREPTKAHHGMSGDEIRELMKQAGFHEVSSKEHSILFRGPVYTGAFRFI